MSGPGPDAAPGSGPTDWVSGERVFGPPGGTLDVDWLVPLLLERPPAPSPASPTREQAAAALRRVWDALREEAARSGVPIRDVEAGALAIRLGLAPPAGDGRGRAPSPPPAREGDDLLRRAVTVVTAAVGAYDAR